MEMTAVKVMMAVAMSKRIACSLPISEIFQSYTGILTDYA